MATWGYLGSAQLGWFTDADVMAAGGLFNPGTDGTLDSLHWFGSIADDVRVALYQGDTADPNGATLLEEFGPVTQSHQSWSVQNSVSNPTLTNGKYLFLAIKTDGTAAIYKSSGTDYDLTVRFDLGNETDDSTDAWDDPCTDPTADGAGQLSMYITYTPDAGSSIAPLASYYYQMLRS